MWKYSVTWFCDIIACQCSRSIVNSWTADTTYAWTNYNWFGIGHTKIFFVSVCAPCNPHPYWEFAFSFGYERQAWNVVNNYWRLIMGINQHWIITMTILLVRKLSRYSYLLHELTLLHVSLQSTEMHPCCQGDSLLSNQSAAVIHHQVQWVATFNFVRNEKQYDDTAVQRKLMFLDLRCTCTELQCRSALGTASADRQDSC